MSLRTGGEVTEVLDLAAREIERADALVITAGAGMGVDSGLPDFRGTEGFWRAYPPIARLGLRFEQMASPTHFSSDPSLAWGFYGHRLNLYRSTRPHRGFSILEAWTRRAPAGGFVFTSNVDGHFQRAGFAEERIVECHGSVLHLQCTAPCTDDVWSAADLAVTVDEETFRAPPPVPSCPSCGATARPNVLLFSDWFWLPHRTAAQEERMRRWLDRVDGRFAVIEIGAGTSVPTVRLTSENLARNPGARLIRINPREPLAPADGIGIPMPGLAALTALDERLRPAGVANRDG